MSSASNGFWLVHSVPHFPANSKTSFYPPGGLENGQMFLCLSLNLTMIDSIGQALELTKPDIYKYSMPDSIAPLLPQLTQVVRNNVSKKSPPWYTTFQIETGDLDLTVFVKGPKFHRGKYL